MEAFHGFWVALPDRPTGAAAPDYATSILLRPRRIPLIQFEGNVAHSNEENGNFFYACAHN